MSIFGDIERLVATLYPLRVPIFIGGLLVLVGVLIVARRRRWDLVVRRHPRVSATVLAAILIVGLPLGWILGSPIFIRTELDEARPAAVVATESDAPASPGPDGSPGGSTTGTDAAVRSGTLSGADEFHFASGEVLLFETAPDSYLLRFEGISVRNGPDLFVYLSPAEGYADDAIEIGPLKASDGSFNYELPPGTDITAYKSAVIWCKAFSVQFAVAALGA